MGGPYVVWRISFVGLNRGREFDISSETWKTFRDGLSVGARWFLTKDFFFFFLSICLGVEFVEM